VELSVEFVSYRWSLMLLRRITTGRKPFNVTLSRYKKGIFFKNVTKWCHPKMVAKSTWCRLYKRTLVFAHLFVKVLRNSEGASSVKPRVPKLLLPVYHLLLPVLPLKSRGNPIKCIAQGHNKRICWLDLRTIPLMLKSSREAVNTNF